MTHISPRVASDTATHFERLARSLPDGQVLRVDITDVDLAGEVDTLKGVMRWTQYTDTGAP